MTHRLLIITLLLCTPLTAGAETSGQDADSDDQWVVGDTTRYDGEARIDTRETTWSNVTVSPDGKTLVFDMLGDIYTMPITGGEAQALTDGIEWSYQPKYSPDGSEIVFERGDRIWTAAPDGSNPQPVEGIVGSYASRQPALSPDGSRIVYFTSELGPIGRLWLFDGLIGGNCHRDVSPRHQAMIPFCACRRFSASSKTTDCGPSIISSVTSSSRCAGRQCIKIASGFASAIKRLLT